MSAGHRHWSGRSLRFVERSLDEQTGEDLLLWRQIGLFSLTSTCDAASMSLAILTIVT